MLVLTPEANAEVKRNLLIAFGLTAGCLLLFVFLLTAAISPPAGTTSFHVASLLLISLPVVAVAGACLTLAYPLACWPGFMRARTIVALYGIDAESVSNKGMRRWTSSRAYWLVFAKGVGVALAFVGPWFLTAWATSSRGFPTGLFFPALLMLAHLGGLAGKAWVVRQLVEERAVGSPSAQS